MNIYILTVENDNIKQAMKVINTNSKKTEKEKTKHIALTAREKDVQKLITEGKKMKTIKTKNNYNLTEREQEVLFYITEGYTNKEIGKLLNVSVHTIKAHVTSLLNKYNVKDRVKLAVTAVRETLSKE